MAIDVSTEEAKLLAEIGFLGIGRGLPAPSAAVFEALANARPDQEAGPIGLALASLAMQAPDRAVEALRRAPQSETVIAFRVVAHAQLGERAVAQELRDELAEAQADPALLEMADGALNETVR